MLRNPLTTNNLITRYVVRIPVGVEKVGFSEKSRKSGDRKCPGDWEKSFVELPDAIQFLQIPSERVFQQPSLLPTAILPTAGVR
jgi:hypothetical protein